MSTGQWLRWAWAGPTSALGLVVGLGALCTGGRVRRQGHTLEFWGGLCSGFLSLGPVRASAMTLGHVILGRSGGDLDRCRLHERVHVDQAERWGPFFLPAYLLASLWAHLQGRHFYRDNPFEEEAYRLAPVSGVASLRREERDR